jgi:hypothetical protein
MRPEAKDESKAPASGGAQPKTTRPQIGSVGVVLRFCVRMLILVVFASIGTVGFAKTFETLLAMAAIYCAGVGPFRREAPLGPVLTHYDEAAAYALCALIVSKAA